MAHIGQEVITLEQVPECVKALVTGVLYGYFCCNMSTLPRLIVMQPFFFYFVLF